MGVLSQHDFRMVGGNVTMKAMAQGIHMIGPWVLAKLSELVEGATFLLIDSGLERMLAMDLQVAPDFSPGSLSRS